MPEPTTTTETERIVLGSVDTYIYEFSGGTLPADATIETEANRLGHTSGGATVNYKPTFYTAKDDFGKVSKTIITDEEASVTLGVCTFNGNKLKTLSPTARVTETTTKRTLKIGGIANNNGKKYLVRLVHTDEADGDIRVTIVGKNEAGFSITFTKDKETVINPEIKCSPIDDDGTLIIYEEEIIADENGGSGEGGGT